MHVFFVVHRSSGLSRALVKGKSRGGGEVWPSAASKNLNGDEVGQLSAASKTPKGDEGNRLPGASKSNGDEVPSLSSFEELGWRRGAVSKQLRRTWMASTCRLPADSKTAMATRLADLG